MSDNLKQQTKKGLYWKFAEQFSNYGIQFIIGIVMARLLSPSDYGITALPAVFMAISSIFISGGFGDALIRKPDLKEEDLSTMFYYSLIVGCLLYIILFSLSPFIAEFYDVPILESLMRVAALSFLWYPLGTPQYVILHRRLDFKTPTKIGIVCKILTGIIGITLAYTGFGLWALVVSPMVGDIIGIFMNWYVVRWLPRRKWSNKSFKYLWEYGNRIMASYMLNTIYENITPILIGKFFTTADLGHYNRAKGYAGMASVNVTGTIQSVTFPVISRIQSDDEKLRMVYRRMLQTTAFVIFPIMVLLSAIAHPLVIVMITDKWVPCVVLLQIMCYSMMWYPIHALNLNLLMVKGRTDLFFRLEVIKKIWGLLILILSLPHGIIVLCCGNVISSLGSLIINTYYTGKLINLGFVQQMKDFFHILVLCLIMFSIVYFVNTYIYDNLLKIIIGSSLGILIYIGGAVIFNFSELKDVMYMLNPKKQQ
ncbi:MAG: lipopolysaccharide biosynthesis protein [Prevotella sp.]|nr:lipopolysaccharide biosynthesis protein [Prevotella sp.]